MSRLEITFDYGAWAVEIEDKHGSHIAYHTWLIVALWRVWRLGKPLPQHYQPKE